MGKKHASQYANFGSLQNFDEELLKSKAATFMKAVGPYEGYEISYKGISIDDM